MIEKNSIKYLSAALFSLIILSGCGQQNASENAADKTEWKDTTVVSPVQKPLEASKGVIDAQVIAARKGVKVGQIYSTPVLPMGTLIQVDLMGYIKSEFKQDFSGNLFELEGGDEYLHLPIPVATIVNDCAQQGKLRLVKVKEDFDLYSDHLDFSADFKSCVAAGLREKVDDELILRVHRSTTFRHLRHQPTVRKLIDEAKQDGIITNQELLLIGKAVEVQYYDDHKLIGVTDPKELVQSW